MKSLQELHAPQNACFGCGPANPKGLHLRSFPAEGAAETDDEIVAEWTPESHHEAFEGVLNGGIVGTLLDCHSNWAAAWHLMRRDGLESPPCTVTADFHVHLKRPTPTDGAVTLTARAVSSDGPNVAVEAEMTTEGKTTATCTGHFVAVKPGHPAYHRW